MITHGSELEAAIQKNLRGMGGINLMSSAGKKLVSVLVVDGDRHFCNTVRADASFNQPGWVVRIASNREEMVRAIGDARVDIFIVGGGLSDCGPIEALQKSKELSPNSLRFLAYSEAEKDLLSKTVGLTHRRVEKPVSPTALNLAVRQVLVTHLRIRKPEVAAIVRDTKELHVNTQPMQELLKTADDPECELEDLARIVMQHPTAVATILQVVNTAFYGTTGDVDTIEEALQILGMDFVRNLAITELAKKQLRLSPSLHELANSILQHSIEASQYGLRMRQYVKNLRLVQQISSIALLHDLGKLVLLAAKGNDYADLMGQSVDSNTPSWKLEREAYKCDHAAIGGFLFAMWGLPEVIVRAVTWHHQPEKVGEMDYCATSLLHFANYAAHSNQGVSCYCGDRLNEVLAEKLGLSPDFAYDFE
ncbi:HDOD domain-containing protein [Pelagicoccus enzymogenes]|uniref:HDOD domain-containing protein n=1 Tax=Pelagicoccus enzymogenes TaxID=2773457 RepID=UPI00280CE577|nr:HDOD domain-containing protein [Pelagicoccus enzymogenes]MDQ8199108.1 HDOD domain-containing protein [Pelagicoccus enzymogenes]